jgi:hypothetical protein
MLVERRADRAAICEAEVRDHAIEVHDVPPYPALASRA